MCVQTNGVEQMTTQINEAIAKLDAKTTDWKGLLTALVALYESVSKGEYRCYSHKLGMTVDAVAQINGVRDFRFNCQSAGNWYGELASRKSTFIPPSEETLAWGGFLGGEYVVTNDSAIEEACERTVLTTISRFAR